MKWLQQNRLLTVFLGAIGGTTLFSLCLLVYEKRAADVATARLEMMVNELNRLRSGVPLPNEKNLRETKAQTQRYSEALAALENELKKWMLSIEPLQPNEFQAQLQLAVSEIEDAAAKARVRLPIGFNFGFDEYAGSLPNGEVAPALGRQLRAIEGIVNLMIEAHIDSLANLTRSPLPEEKTNVAAPNRASERQTLRSGNRSQTIVDCSAIDVSFSASPAVARRVINQIAACKNQIYVIRTLVVKNQVDKGPKRNLPETVASDAASIPQKSASPSSPPSPKGTKEEGITFIVGTEHLDLAAQIEIVSFASLKKQAR